MSLALNAANMQLESFSSSANIKNGIKWCQILSFCSID